jgi:hypothetical protein
MLHVEDKKKQMAEEEREQLKASCIQAPLI